MPDQEHCRRRSLRLWGYDYSQAGAYFVTICTQSRQRRFGDIVDGEMRLNEAGRMVESVWEQLPARFPTFESDSFLVMPNHIHGILVLVGAGLALPVKGAASSAPTTTRSITLSDVVRVFKSMSAIDVNRFLSRSGQSLWQRSYYEHIVRNDTSLNRIREYIATNPLRWELDRENPQRTGQDDFDRWLTTFTAPSDRVKSG